MDSDFIGNLLFFRNCFLLLIQLWTIDSLSFNSFATPLIVLFPFSISLTYSNFCHDLIYLCLFLWPFSSDNWLGWAYTSFSLVFIKWDNPFWRDGCLTSCVYIFTILLTIYFSFALVISWNFYRPDFRNYVKN